MSETRPAVHHSHAFLPWNIASLLLQGYGRLAGLPGVEALHLGEGGGVPHPLDSLVVGHNPHVLALHLHNHNRLPQQVPPENF
jgi:hypothetical protein